MRQLSDQWLPEVLSLQAQLRDAATQWSQGVATDPDIEGIRHAALRLNHKRYVELIPAYRWLAEGQGLLHEVDLDTIVNQLMFTDAVFKSYDPRLLGSGDFVGMTQWLETVFTRPIDLGEADIQDINAWKTQLRKKWIFLSYSSGTSGQLSFIPRDLLTWNALRFNSHTYADHAWFFDPTGQPKPFDCLVAGPRGNGMGIQGAATGLASMAQHAHFLFDEVLTEDIVRDLSRSQAGPSESAVTKAFLQEMAQSAPYRRAFDFIRAGMDERRPLLIFGTPFQLKRLCEQALSQCGPLTVAPESIVVTGGGWKSFLGEKISSQHLREMIAATLGGHSVRVIDAYSTAELNCTLISCPAWRYHIPPLLEPVVLDEAFTGAVGQEGWGMLGFLDPFALSYPGFMITGDVGQLQRGPCSCGRRGWCINGEIQRAPQQQLKGCGGVMAAMTPGESVAGWMPRG